MRKQHGGGDVQVFRITGARQGLQDDVRGRQRRYVISMSVRTVAVILAATLWNVERHVAVVALVLGVVLPYVAVVIANAGRENAPGLPSTFVTAPLPPMIAPPRADEAEERAARDEPLAKSTREEPASAREETEPLPKDTEAGPAERRP
ncbi:DUF3099 domain-containing protein [Streptomyces phaeoluteigriseus]|uniref:DUF3099 domain-containing protein n=1 Tax=Streptomyces phaeoluteigriseus TaxID=114686 RepID=A0ABY4ZEU5_9ACTN|nr:DUF3099 domain-containing protein [Streptomyces phaeoluteigriseus]USQ87531.1 DUF3099 domain-containing protein [Streptomyces phaeoluteigriseus]